MRYIKIPKNLSAFAWTVGCSIPKDYEHLCKVYIGNVLQYSTSFGCIEYMIDVEVFRSELLKELLK